jgi:FkbM family methyltransferase
VSIATLLPTESRTLMKRHLPFWALRYLKKTSGNRSPYLIDLVGRYLSHNPVIVEAGANNGDSTLSLWKQWPQARIFAFEPVPAVYRQLVRATRGIPNIVCTNCALGERESRMTMNLSSNNYASSSLLRPAKVAEIYSTVDFTEQVEVPVVNLQEFLAQRGVESVDLMWLDMQGYEPYVLAACPQLLETVKVIRTEVNLTETYAGAVLYDRFREHLEAAGLVVIDESIGETEGDIVCVRRELLEPGWKH